MVHDLSLVPAGGLTGPCNDYRPDPSRSAFETHLRDAGPHRGECGGDRCREPDLG